MAEVSAEVSIDAEAAIERDPLARSQPARERDPGEPFRIAIVGDFSGRAQRDAEARAAIQAIEIDPENFESVMDRMHVSATLAAGDVNLALRFRELDDFHPDNIYRSSPLFKVFEEARKELAKPRAKTAEGPLPHGRGSSESEPSAPAAPPPAPPAGGSLLDMIAAAQSPAPPPPKPKPSATDPAAWDSAIRGIAAKHALPKADARQEQAVAQLESTAASAMRAILSDARFQALEAAWRSIFFLFQHLDTGVELKIYLIDATRQELASGALRKILTGGEKFAAIAGLYTFTHSEADCAQLAKIAEIASAAGAPFLAAMHPRLFGCESIAATPDPADWKAPADGELAAWKALRQSAGARWLGLAMPRFLLRVPYGAKTSSIDCFDFEEMPNAPDHEAYLWANPAIAVAGLLGAAYSQAGWEMRPGSINKLSSIAVHAIGQGEVTPPAEIWLTERFAMRMIDEGVMPLASVKHSDAIQLVYLKSIADPSQPLAGAWLR